MSKIKTRTFPPVDPLLEPELHGKVRAYYESELGHLQTGGIHDFYKALLQEVTRSFRGGDSRATVDDFVARSQEDLMLTHDRMAPRYDEGRAEVGWDRYTKAVTFIAQSLGAADEHIVDCGCGTGIELTILASLFPDKRFTGYDISSRMLEMTAERLGRYGCSNVDLIQGSHLGVTFAPADIALLFSMIDETDLVLEEPEEAPRLHVLIKLINSKNIAANMKRGGKLFQPGVNPDAEIPYFEFVSGFSLAQEVFLRMYEVMDAQESAEYHEKMQESLRF